MPPSCSVTAADAVKKITAELKQPKLVAEVEKAKKAGARAAVAHSAAQLDFTCLRVAVKSMEDVMREIVPFLFEVQGHVMKQYGFVPDEDGADILLCGCWLRRLGCVHAVFPSRLGDARAVL